MLDVRHSMGSKQKVALTSGANETSNLLIIIRYLTNRVSKSAQSNGTFNPTVAAEPATLLQLNKPQNPGINVSAANCHLRPPSKMS